MNSETKHCRHISRSAKPKVPAGADSMLMTIINSIVGLDIVIGAIAVTIGVNLLSKATSGSGS